MISLRTKLSMRALTLSALGAFAFSLHGQPITGNPTAHTYSRTFNVSEADGGCDLQEWNSWPLRMRDH